MIITQGVANFLNSGVAASQIVLTVRDQIAGVSHPPAFPAYVVKCSPVDQMITKAVPAVHIAPNMLTPQTIVAFYCPHSLTLFHLNKPACHCVLSVPCPGPAVIFTQSLCTYAM